MTVAVTTFGVGIDHVAPSFIIDRIAVVVLSRVQQRREFLATLIAATEINLIAGFARQRQSVNHISGHEWIALVVFPPAPTAIVMLIGV